MLLLSQGIDPFAYNCVSGYMSYAEMNMRAGNAMSKPVVGAVMFGLVAYTFKDALDTAPMFPVETDDESPER